jgi:hypothetical protein
MKTKLLGWVLSTSVLLMPALALAHEHQIFNINGSYYQFTVGSLNEPVAVDDKTGVDLKVEQVTAEHAMEKHDDSMPHVAETFPTVPGLDKTLKIELNAGGAKKVLGLSPVWNTPGSYKANFIPTVQTSFSYRFLGTVNNTPVDLTFTCLPEGQTAAEDTKMVKMSDKVSRVSKAGGFGCPVAKADLGFPQQSASTYDLVTKDAELTNTVSKANMTGLIGIVLGVLGLAAGAGALMMKKRGPVA